MFSAVYDDSFDLDGEGRRCCKGELKLSMDFSSGGDMSDEIGGSCDMSDALVWWSFDDFDGG